MRRTAALLLAESPEDVYRVSLKHRPFLRLLPLPKMTLKPKKRKLKWQYLKQQMAVPKPRWYHGLSQATLYTSVMKYTEHQLTDEKLFKEEKYIASNMTMGSFREDRLERQLQESIVQPAFSEIKPDPEYYDKLHEGIPHNLELMMGKLKATQPSLLPHPALAAHGEALVEEVMVDFMTDLFPRLHSAQLGRLLKAKLSLSNAVNAAVRAGLAKGMALDKEVKLYNNLLAVNARLARASTSIRESADKVARGSLTENMEGHLYIEERAKWGLAKLSVSKEHVDLLEERMKLLSRHLYGFLAYASYTKGDAFVKAFVLRYFMPDVAVQYFSNQPMLRSWLEVNNRWKFLPASSKATNELVPSGRTAQDVPMVINGVVTHSNIVAKSVRQMVTSPTPMKELAIITAHDMLSKQLLKGRKLRYVLQFQGHHEEEGHKFMRVGVYAGDILLGEGEGVDFELASKSAAQNALQSYYLNPKMNFKREEGTEMGAGGTKQKVRRRRVVRRKVKKESS